MMTMLVIMTAWIVTDAGTSSKSNPQTQPQSAKQQCDKSEWMTMMMIALLITIVQTQASAKKYLLPHHHKKKLRLSWRMLCNFNKLYIIKINVNKNSLIAIIPTAPAMEMESESTFWDKALLVVALCALSIKMLHYRSKEQDKRRIKSKEQDKRRCNKFPSLWFRLCLFLSSTLAS